MNIFVLLWSIKILIDWLIASKYKWPNLRRSFAIKTIQDYRMQINERQHEWRIKREFFSCFLHGYHFWCLYPIIERHSDSVNKQDYFYYYLWLLLCHMIVMTKFPHLQIPENLYFPFSKMDRYVQFRCRSSWSGKTHISSGSWNSHRSSLTVCPDWSRWSHHPLHTRLTNSTRDPVPQVLRVWPCIPGEPAISRSNWSTLTWAGTTWSNETYKTEISMSHQPISQYSAVVTWLAGMLGLEAWASASLISLSG